MGLPSPIHAQTPPPGASDFPTGAAMHLPLLLPSSHTWTCTPTPHTPRTPCRLRGRNASEAEEDGLQASE